MMIGSSILVVDDDFQIRRVLRATLLGAGFDVIEARNGQEASEKAVREHPSLILLDMNMPDMSGLEACRKLRLSFEGPIIMVTVRNAERDKVDAFNSGADDYVVKPFAIGELLARIRIALKHAQFESNQPAIATPDLSIDIENRIVEVRGERVHMTPKEFEVLRTLVAQQGKPVSYRKILQTVWGPDYAEETEKVRSVIGQIRKKIEVTPARPRHIVTEPWYGYRFEVAEETRESSNPRKS
jgi:two-component system, OmpR family, KDP operon response regulator KdpE